MRLTKSQEAALKHFEKIALSNKETALSTIKHILRMCNVSESDNNTANKNLKLHSKIALHFHPDRPVRDNLTVVESLLKSGKYKSQFETKISNGDVSAYPGGDRDHWEKEIYGGSYHKSDFMGDERPKYGALSVFDFPDGPAPRFGSCYFLLKSNVLNRATFTYLDSHLLPQERGTIKEFDHIYSELLTEIFTRNFVLGLSDLTVPKFVSYLKNDIEHSMKDYSKKIPKRNLNYYIETQVHGDINLNEDIEALVADPSFKETEIGDKLIELSNHYNFSLHWHKGFKLLLTDVPLDFRGPTMPSLAKRVANEKEFITTNMIGDAVRNLKENPEQWEDRGEFKEVLQELKLLWHVLVTFG